MDFVGNAIVTGTPIADGDRYGQLVENRFIKTSDENVSTFSIDADGASYANAKAYILDGRLPYTYAIRVEEFLNYFTFDYPAPEAGNTVAINTETAACPWEAGHTLLRLGIKGMDLAANEIPKANFVFLVDVSGSMSSPDKIGLLKDGLCTMLDYLNPEDRISLITYSGEVRKLLESTPAKEARKIKNAIKKLDAGGSTAGGAALDMAYKEAMANYIEGGNNRIIMGTDGDFNVGVSSTDALTEMVESYAKKGIYLTVCGFGHGNLNDEMMESISNHGNGTYEFIGSEDDLTKVFVNERSKFVSVANDVKIQVTFDPEMVESYRLIGYENRLLDKEDFTDDKKDAGEIGAGQTITALYELILKDGAATGSKLGSFDLRYKKALGDGSIPLQAGMKLADANARLSGNMSFAAGTAMFAMLLRESEYCADGSYAKAKELVNASLGFDPFGYRKQLVKVIEKAMEVAEKK